MPPYVRLSHLYGGRLKVSFNPSASHWHPQEHSPALASGEMISRVPFKLRPFPRAHGSPVLHGQDVTPGEYYDRMSPSVQVVLWPTWRFVPRTDRGASLFGIVSTLGPLGIPSGVGPGGTRRSHSHPSKGFPCPLPWTLQRGVGGGYLIPYAAHCGTQPGNGVSSRLTRFSRPTRSYPQASWVRSSDMLRNGSSCYPIRCGGGRGRLPRRAKPTSVGFTVPRH